MSETEEDDEDEKKEPSGIVEDGDEGHDRDAYEKNGAAPPSEKGIDDMPSIQLAHGQEIQGRHKKADPPGIPDGMKKNIVLSGT